MKARYALFIALGFCTLSLGAQTVLSESAYATLKANGQLPEHPVIVADQQQHKLIPHPGAMKGGGGCDCWVEPDGTYSLAMAPNDDLSSELITLPFTFTLFGDAYTELYINNNGNISFDMSYGTFSSNAFPDSTFIMVAPFWADVDTRGDDGLGLNGGEVWYKVTPTALYVNWVDVGYYSMLTDKKNAFQLIVTDGTDPAVPWGNNASFCYKDMQWTTGAASAGNDGFGGIPATVGANRGNGVDHAQIGRFAWDTENYGGAYADTSGISWLDSTHFYMNTTGGGIPPIFGSDFNCDTVIVQMDGEGAHSPLSGRLSIIPGGPDQQVSCTSTAPTLPNYVALNTGYADHLVFPLEINTTDAAIGTHYVTFTATNDQPVPLVSQYVLQVEVLGITTGLGTAPAVGEYSAWFDASADQLMVRSGDLSGSILVEVLASDGRVLLAKAGGAGSFGMPCNGLNPGAYTARITGPEGFSNLRFVRY